MAPDVRYALDAIDKDISRVHVRATAALAIAGALVTQFDLSDLRKLHGVWDGVMVGGLVLLLLAAVAYFQYTQELNKARIAIAADASGVKRLEQDEQHPWLKFVRRTRVWSRGRGWLRLYDVGQLAFLLGVAAVAAVVGKLVI